ncbi:nuclear receptor coactivator 1-like [Notothenia coriiceps]|uniref:Nuclear receptor coactivator 1-like n=1 Tax=Notothenia coriiceps TaxID=8208 RepID=A0A6I9N8H7_9TELE|nr:PREDICTED: nuclear receptor coactivator 1-like [Notothenia coriiceps]
MLAQRQRELYSIQHRQRQMFQQKVLLMRQNLAVAPTKGPPTTPQPQQQQQQFTFPPGYNSPMTGKPPTSPSPFSPLSPGAPLDNKLPGRVPLSSPTLMSGVQGQFSSSVNASLQQGLFQQFGGAVIGQAGPHPFPSGG